MAEQISIKKSVELSKKEANLFLKNIEQSFEPAQLGIDIYKFVNAYAVANENRVCHMYYLGSANMKIDASISSKPKSKASIKIEVQAFDKKSNDVKTFKNIVAKALKNLEK